MSNRRANNNGAAPVVLKQLFDEARHGLPDGTLKQQTLAFLRVLEGVTKARPEFSQLLHTLSGLRTVPRLASLSKAMYQDHAAVNSLRRVKVTRSSEWSAWLGVRPSHGR